jgi:hypothetical protein
VIALRFCGGAREIDQVLSQNNENACLNIYFDKGTTFCSQFCPIFLLFFL